MRRLLLVLGLLWGIPALSQTTSVSGTIVDTGAQAWANGSVTFTFRPADSNPTGQYFQGGVPFDKNTTIGPLALDNTGSFSGVAVPDNNTITPAQSKFSVKVCPAATTSCVTVALTIAGATQNISAQIVPSAVHLDLSVPLLGARAYTDPEVFGAVPGTMYFNLADNRIHVCLQTGFPPCTWFVLNGGGGTVTNVSSGNFSPLFNVSVSNPTTTPAFSFTALNAGAGTIFGNPGGAPAAPSFSAPSSFTGIVTNIATSSPISGGPITSTGTISCPTCVTSVSGTANQITSIGGTTPTLSIPATFIAPGSVRATTALRGATVTDDGLTSGNCVQAGAAGLLTTIAGPCANGSGFTQIATASAVGCTTQGTSFSNCDVTMTWSSAFADTGYIPSCSVRDTNLQASGGDGSSGDVPNAPIRSFTATQITVALTTLAARVISGAANATIYCMGVHP
jgi:hypothetical protein